MLNAGLKKLPYFAPYDTRQLLADAHALAGDSDFDSKVRKAYGNRCRSQIAYLLKALGCDPADDNFWANAFVRLARIHRDVGRLVHRRAARHDGARTWSVEDEALLLTEVISRTALGRTERQAVREIAAANIFPYHERRPYQRSKGKASIAAKFNALWRKHRRMMAHARKRSTPWLSRALGLGIESSYEWLLWRFDNPTIDLSSSGDKGLRQKTGIRKSPAR